jgi:ABC-type transport system substrate-binding protein
MQLRPAICALLLQDPSVRQATGYALDRQTPVNKVWQGNAAMLAAVGVALEGPNRNDANPIFLPAPRFSSKPSSKNAGEAH